MFLVHETPMYRPFLAFDIVSIKNFPEEMIAHFMCELRGINDGDTCSLIPFDNAL